jgi:hypothetical protein
MGTSHQSDSQPSKQCPRCGETKPLSAFDYRDKPRGTLTSHCTACRRQHHAEYAPEYNARRRGFYATDPTVREITRERNRVWKEQNRERENTRSRDRHQEYRRIVIERYGGACACCGETAIEFLVVDHVNGDGAQDRRAIGVAGIYRKLAKAETVLAGYRVLCHNCNSAYARYGSCPHTVAPTP